MLIIYRIKERKLELPVQTNFSSHKILERQDIEKWIENNPEILGEELFIITSEYDKFDKTNERLDLLALDRMGNLVVIELKRDDSGKDVDIQAIKYAAYCSTLTLDNVIQIHQQYLLKNEPTNVVSEDEIRSRINSFVEAAEIEELNDTPRIIIVAGTFRPEVTASVLWLRNFGVDIKCVRLSPYMIDSETLGFEAITLIPLPEAEEYVIKAEQKSNVTATPSKTQREYLDFYSELNSRISSDITSDHLVAAKPQFYHKVSSFLPGVHFEWCFHGQPRDSFGVELHFEKADANLNKILFREVRDTFKTDLESKACEKLLEEENWRQNFSRLYFEKKQGHIDEELKKWAIDKMLIFYNTVNPHLSNIDK